MKAGLPLVIGFALCADGCCTNHKNSGGRVPQLTGTAHHRNTVAAERKYYWGESTYLLRNAEMPPPWTPLDWCQLASDKTKARESRCYAAALIFGYYVKPGFTTKDMRDAIPRNDWLDDCSVTIFNALGGEQPCVLDGTHYAISLFPDEGTDPWFVFFTLARESPYPIDKCLEFLKGKGDQESLTISEIVLSYPLPAGAKAARIEERHSPKGVGISLQPGGWFQ
jgi:hypothetical protein